MSYTVLSKKMSKFRGPNTALGKRTGKHNLHEVVGKRNDVSMPVTVIRL